MEIISRNESLFILYLAFFLPPDFWTSLIQTPGSDDCSTAAQCESVLRWQVPDDPAVSYPFDYATYESVFSDSWISMDPATFCMTVRKTGTQSTDCAFDRFPMCQTSHSCNKLGEWARSHL